MGALVSNDFDPFADLPDLKGKVVVVAPGIDSVGIEIVKCLVRRGAKVYVGAPSKLKARRALSPLRTDPVRRGEVVEIIADFGDPQKVKEAAERLLTMESRLDILVNNANMSSNDPGPNPIVHHLSRFVFTRTLLPRLARTAVERGSDVRIVNISSDSCHRGWYPSLNDMNQYFKKSWELQAARPGQLKLSNILWTRKLQRRLTADLSPVLVMALHLGNVHDDMLRTLWAQCTFSWLKTYLLAYLRPRVVIRNVLFAIASPVVRTHPNTYSGAYLVPIGEVAQLSEKARNPQLASELWDLTENILKVVDL
ncbi:hypothetical protein JAAARDRAFT_66213 [Jaapia argillacea MUCL 33604]|uniref:Ketoreductase (KR) domain-containing protein n=1 Tax=Jaapia argillacea MUCL 33604 TaxID=933084 RepID=A0A067Q629_9AGAM|nr:hypothetical protein JAAARDRAFT_66213 [Jaapia argillacea MUCL 33604]